LADGWQQAIVIRKGQTRLAHDSCALCEKGHIAIAGDLVTEADASVMT
jgi:hypothetical protein